MRYSGAVLMLETRRQEIPGEKKSLFQPLHCLPLYSLGSERVSVPLCYLQQTIFQQKVFVSITSFASILILGSEHVSVHLCYPQQTTVSQKKSFCLNHMNRIQFTHMLCLFLSASLQSPIFLMYASFLVNGRILPTSSP